MHRDREVQEALGVNSEQLLENHEMSAAADRKKFRKTLDNAENQSLPPFHNLFLPLFPDFHYREYFQADSGQYDYRRENEPAEVEHRLVEDCGIIASPANHYDISRHHHEEADKEQPESPGGHSHFSVIHNILSINNIIHPCPMRPAYSRQTRC